MANQNDDAFIGKIDSININGTMDEIDRPGEGQGPRVPSPFTLDNRPDLQISSGDESLDEVDRPSSLMPETPRSEPELKLGSDDEKNNDDEKDNAFVIPNEAVVKFRTDEFEIIETTEITDKESSDGAPGSGTDGRFSLNFIKHSPLLEKRVMEKTDKEGIVSSHVTYWPKEQQTKHGKDKHEVNSDYYYPMNTFPRGRLTLINVERFRRASGMADYPRHGTNRDADGLCKLFLELGFIVDRFDNPTKKEIFSILSNAALQDYTNLSCCACALFSHGEEGIIYGTDGYVKIKEITRLFRSRTLAGKPKFFLFQACQGSEYMDPLDSVDGPGRQVTEKDMALTLPSEADFLYAYSTVPGFYSWRNSRRGSWFIETLIAVFRESAHKMDVLRMLTRVNAHVAHRKSRTDDVITDDKRQIASIVTQMRKDFFLFPPYGPLEQATITS